MKKKRLTLWDQQALDAIDNQSFTDMPAAEPGKWIQLLRSRLRMTQIDLAKRAGLDQAHLARIESGKIEPSLKTLKSIFGAMRCGIMLCPRPEKSFDEILLDQAREVALTRLKQSMGSMALEKQAPDARTFQALVNKKTQEIVQNTGINLWREPDGG